MNATASEIVKQTYNNKYNIAEFTDKDISLNVEGLSDEYAQRFRNKKQVLVNYLNKLLAMGLLPDNIKPIRVKVVLQNNIGLVGLAYSYNPDNYSDNDPLSKRRIQYGFPKGANMKLEYMLFDALSYYKLQVANNGNYSIDKRLTEFNSIVMMNKANGDSSTLFAYNILRNDASYPLFIEPIISLRIGGKEFKIQAANSELLNEYHIFSVGESIDLNGKQNKNYYFYKFYNIPSN